jgi:hypothetical protein
VIRAKLVIYEPVNGATSWVQTAPRAGSRPLIV